MEKIKVTYTFTLPDHEEQLDEMLKAQVYLDVIKEIYSRCEDLWKSHHASNPKLASFATSIEDLCEEFI